MRSGGLLVQMWVASFVRASLLLTKEISGIYALFLTFTKPILHGDHPDRQEACLELLKSQVTRLELKAFRNLSSLELHCL